MITEEQFLALQQKVETLETRERARTARPRFSGATALAAAFLLGLTLTCAGRAYAVASVPNQMELKLQMPANSISAAIPWPAADTPMILSVARGGPEMLPGTGFVHLTYDKSKKALTWIGFHSEGGSGGASAAESITRGYVGQSDQLIMFLYLPDSIRIETHIPDGGVNGPSHCKALNNSPFAVTLVLDFIW